MRKHGKRHDWTRYDLTPVLQHYNPCPLDQLTELVQPVVGGRGRFTLFGRIATSKRELIERGTWALGDEHDEAHARAVLAAMQRMFRAAQ